MTTGVTLVELALHDPAREEELLRWWDGVRALLADRFHATEAELAVFARGRYLATIGFPLPGVWKLVTRDARWRQLEAERPPAEVSVRQARRWHREGAPRDVTTSELARLVAGGGVVLVDARPREAYDEGHLPGAISLPAEERDDARVVALVGDRDRTVVTYCSGYG